MHVMYAMSPTPSPYNIFVSSVMRLMHVIPVTHVITAIPFARYFQMC